MTGATTKVLYAKVLNESTSADELLPLSQAILERLNSHGVKVISYTTDGAQTERTIQSGLVANTLNHITYTIRHPEFPDGPPLITITIPVIGGYPVVIFQDANHLAKMLRNNVRTGARTFTFGNHIMTWQDVFEQHLNCRPLFFRKTSVSSDVHEIKFD